MGFDLEKRFANELNRIADEGAHADKDVQRRQKHVERLKKIAAELKQQVLGSEVAEGAPGKRTELDDAVASAIKKLDDTAKRVRGFHVALPWQQQQRTSFDDYRAHGLREVLTALTSRKLRSATLASADSAIATRANVNANANATQATAAGHAMWRAAERRAATLYRHAMDSGDVASDDPIVDEALERCGSGRQLPLAVRKQMEEELGISLARVRVHDDPVAAAAARAVRAEAFTVGEDIFFAENAYAPESREGKKLLAHELTHVVQTYQGRVAVGGTGIKVSQPGESLEREADAVAERIGERIDARAQSSAGRDAAIDATPRTRRGGRGAALDTPRTRNAGSAQTSRARRAGSMEASAPRTRGASRGLASASAPVPAAAPVLAPVPKGATLMRRRALAGQASARDSEAPRIRTQDPNKRGTRPRLLLERDRSREASWRSARSGAAPVRGAGAQVAQDVRAAAQGSVAQLRSTTADVGRRGVGKRARDLGLQERRLLQQQETEAQQLQRQAEHAVPSRGRGGPKPPKLEGKSGGNVGVIKWKNIDDWNKYMPAELPDQDKRERRRILGLVQARINGERRESAILLNQLYRAQMGAAGQVRGMLPGLAGQINMGKAAAVARVSAAETSQVTAVRSHVSGVMSRVRATATSMINQINTAHRTTVTAIRDARRDATTTLRDARTAALTDIDRAESLQLAIVSLQFSTTRIQITALGASKASEASARGDSYPLDYSGDKYDAARKAAREVAAEYAAQMPVEAGKAYEQIAAEKPNVERDVRQMAREQRTQIRDAFTQCKEVIDQAAEQAITAANEMKTQAVSQVRSTSSTTCSQLMAHRAQQIAAIRRQGTSARDGITQAGDAALAAVTQGVNKAASGIEAGARALVNGCRRVENPNPGQTRQRVAQGVGQVQQAAQSAGSSMRQTATGAVTGMTTQAEGAAQGMEETASAAKQTATQMGTGAQTSMRQISQSAREGLQQLRQNFRENATTIAREGTTAMTGIVDGLRDAYREASSSLREGLRGAVDSTRSSFDDAVTPQEDECIAENAKKAADAVKPWWQKALAFVVSVVVAIAVVVVVTALIVTTGPVGAILVGAAAGALGSVLGQMASNLVLGNGLMEGITWQTVAMGAVGGAIGAGFSQAAIAGARQVGGQALVNTMSSGGGMGGLALRTGVGMAGDVVSDAATQVIFTGGYQFDMANFATSLVTNVATSTTSYDNFQSGIQDGIRAQTGHIQLGVPNGGLINLSPDYYTAGVPAIDINDPGTWAGGDAGGSGGGSVDVSPPGSGGADVSPPRSGAESTTGGGSGGGGGGGGATVRSDAPGAPRPDTPSGTPGGDTTRTPHTDTSPGTPGADATTPRADTTPGRTPDSDASSGTPDTPSGRPRPDTPSGTPHPDPTSTPRGETGGDTTQGRGVTPGDTTPGAIEAGGDTTPARTAPAADGPGGVRGGEPATGARDAAAGDRDAGGARESGADADALPDGPENVAADALSTLGYPNPTRPKADQAAAAIESGTRPPPDAVRDTDANQQGLRALDRLDTDPRVTPESRQNIRNDVASKMRSDEPSGNLNRDVRQARGREQIRVDAERARVRAEQQRVQAEQARLAEQQRQAQAAQDGDATLEGGSTRPPEAAPARTEPVRATDPSAAPVRTPMPAPSTPDARVTPEVLAKQSGLSQDVVTRLQSQNNPDMIKFTQAVERLQQAKVARDALVARGEPSYTRTYQDAQMRVMEAAQDVRVRKEWLQGAAKKVEAEANWRQATAGGVNYDGVAADAISRISGMYDKPTAAMDLAARGVIDYRVGRTRSPLHGDATGPLADSDFIFDAQRMTSGDPLDRMARAMGLFADAEDGGGYGARYNHLMEMQARGMRVIVEDPTFSDAFASRSPQMRGVDRRFAYYIQDGALRIRNTMLDGTANTQPIPRDALIVTEDIPLTTPDGARAYMDLVSRALGLRPVDATRGPTDGVDSIRTPSSAEANANATDDGLGRLPPQLMHPGGLADPKARAGFEQGVQRLLGDWPHLSSDQRLQRLGDILNSTLETNGFPPVDVQHFDMTSDGNAGFFDATNWRIVMSTDLMRPDVDMNFITDLLAHEARHSEQHYLVARLMVEADPRVSDAEIATQMGVPVEVVARARAEQANLTPEQMAGAEVYHRTFYGEDNRAFSETMAGLHESRRALDLAAAELERINGDPSSTPQMRAAAEERLRQAQETNESFEDRYRSLPHERDAFAVGGNVDVITQLDQVGRLTRLWNRIRGRGVVEGDVQRLDRDVARARERYDQTQAPEDWSVLMELVEQRRLLTVDPLETLHDAPIPARGTLGDILSKHGETVENLRSSARLREEMARVMLEGAGFPRPTPEQVAGVKRSIEDALISGTWGSFKLNAAQAEAGTLAEYLARDRDTIEIIQRSEAYKHQIAEVMLFEAGIDPTPEQFDAFVRRMDQAVADGTWPTFRVDPDMFSGSSPRAEMPLPETPLPSGEPRLPRDASHADRRAALADHAMSTLEAFTTRAIAGDDWQAINDPRNWTPERQAFHESALERAFADAQRFVNEMANADPGSEPTLYAMRGNTAAGKTRAMRSGETPELASAVHATADARHASSNPDNFKQDIYANDPDLQLTANQVHTESSSLSERLHQRVLTEARRPDGTPGDMLVDKRLAWAEDVAVLQADAARSGRRFALLDVDADLATSLAGVLARTPGGTDPIPPFDVIRNGFLGVRSERLQVIEQIAGDPNSSYRLMGTRPNGDKFLIAEIKPLNRGEMMPDDPMDRLLIHDEVAYERMIPTREHVELDALATADQVITARLIEQITAPLGDYGATLRVALERHEGKTWRQAVDDWSKALPSGETLLG